MQSYSHFLPLFQLQTSQDDPELVTPVIPHPEAVLFVLAIADFDAFQFVVQTEETVSVDFLNGNALRRHPALVFGPAKDEPARLQAQVAGDNVDRVHRIRVLLVAEDENEDVGDERKSGTMYIGIKDMDE